VIVYATPKRSLVELGLSLVQRGQRAMSSAIDSVDLARAVLDLSARLDVATKRADAAGRELRSMNDRLDLAGAPDAPSVVDRFTALWNRDFKVMRATAIEVEALRTKLASAETREAVLRAENACLRRDLAHAKKVETSS